MTRTQTSLFLTSFAVALFASGTIACSAPADDGGTSTDDSADALRRKKPKPVPTSPAPDSLRDGRYVIRGVRSTNEKQLAGVVLEQHGAARVVEIRTPMIMIPNVPVNPDGSFTATGQASPHWQFRYDGHVGFDGETLRFDLMEDEVAPGSWTATYHGEMGLGSVLVQEAASHGGTFAAGIRTQQLPGTWSTGVPIAALVAFQTSSGRTFITEPDALAGKGCLFGYALEVPTGGTVSSPAIATLATATGGTCGDWDPCNIQYSARLVARPTSLSYSCHVGNESHAIQTDVPTFAP